MELASQECCLHRVLYFCIVFLESGANYSAFGVCFDKICI